MTRFIQRVAFTVAAELVAYVISEAIIKNVEDKKDKNNVDVIYQTIF